jgi:hypothetical protein
MSDVCQFPAGARPHLYELVWGDAEPLALAADGHVPPARFLAAARRAGYGGPGCPYAENLGLSTEIVRHAWVRETPRGLTCCAPYARGAAPVTVIWAADVRREVAA